MTHAKAVLSHHAIERLADRSKASADMLIEVLNTRRCTQVGRSRTKPRVVDWLYWSPDDAAPFVAIQDSSEGTVLTVLTLAQYERHFPDNVGERRVRAVIDKMILAGRESIALWGPDSKVPGAIVHATLSNSAQPCALGRWRQDLPEPNLKLLGRNPSFWTWVVQALSARGRAVDDLEWVTARFPGGDPEYIGIAC